MKRNFSVMAQDIKSEVEKRLQQKQKSKDFKDIGRVDNTRKELAAYRLINIDNLDELEQDKVIAFNMVKKENVWKPYDIVQEKEKGVSSGAAYLKVKIRESLPAKPKDSEAYRKAYVTALTTIQNEFETCKTIDDIRNVTSAWYKLNPYNYTLKFVGGIPESITEEQFNKDYLNKNYYFRFTKIFEEQFGVRFYNTVYRKSDAGDMVWVDATKYDGIDEELLVKAKESIQKKIENTENKYNKYINDFTDANDQTLRNLVKSTFNSNGSIGLSLKQQGVEVARQLALNYFEREKKQQLDKLNQSLSNLKLTDPDWSWGIKTVDEQDGKKGEVTVKVKARAINSKEPLAYIKRTGGYEITDISPKAIIDNFGFGSVNYGNYVDDKWSKEHTKHFLGAMLDMGEILNIDIKKLTSLGNLKIAFGAKGRAGHLATYFPQTKDINLTKGNGDGSVAHEYGHYIDNVIMEGSERSSSSVFITETFKSKDYELNMLFRSLMDFIRKGSPEITPRVPFRFYAQKSLSKPEFFYGGRSAEYDIKDTIEETLKQQTLVNLAKSDANIQSLQKKVFGYVISQFGLDYYDIPLRLTTSYYFHKSAYNQFIYNYNNDKNEYVVASDKRTKYWTSDVELFARAFETVVLKKFLDKNRVSNYLVDGIPLEDTVRENYHVPYPSGKELEHIESIIDSIIKRIKEYYVIDDFKAPESVRSDEYIDLSQSGLESKGIVVTKDKNKEKVAVIGEEPKIENKADFIEKRIRALKISLRFSKDKEFIEKRIKALEISLKVLGKKESIDNNNSPLNKLIRIMENKINNQGYSLKDLYDEVIKMKGSKDGALVFSEFIKRQKDNGNNKLIEEFNRTSFVENIHSKDPKQQAENLFEIIKGSGIQATKRETKNGMFIYGEKRPNGNYIYETFVSYSEPLTNDQYELELAKFRRLHFAYDNQQNKFAGGGGVDYFPPKGELVNKSNHLLKYEKKGDEYVFNVYEPVKPNIDSYEKIRRVCKTKDYPLRMTYKQFINYLYAETYIDDNKFAGGGGVETLINQGIVELNFYETTPEHAKQYGLKAKKPLFVQNLFVSKEERLKEAGKKVLNYLDEYAIKNGNDVIFGYVGQKSSFTKDSKQTTFSDIELIKYWLHENGYAINDDNNDFHKVVSKFAGGGGVERLLAPNGKPSNLTPEQYKLVRTKAFKDWFGDWENDPANASKVVDSNGEPLVVYHGTTKYFTIFNKKYATKNTKVNHGYLGHFFTPNFDLAIDFTKKDWTNSNSPHKSNWFYAMKCFLNIKNPKSTSVRGFTMMNTTKDTQNMLKEYGYDGVIVNKWEDDEKESWISLFGSKGVKEFDYKQFVAFNSSQIKLADGTNTTFDGNNPDIRFKEGGLVQSDNFKNWFKKSKVVDKKGNPLVVYHGSPDLRGLKESYIFEPRFGGDKSFFFTDNYNMAKSYADPKRAFDYQNAEEGVLSLYLSIQNPLIVEGFNQIWRKFETVIDGIKIIGTNQLIGFAKENGYDGVIVENIRDYYNDNEKKSKGGNVYVAFEQTQIKLADGTNITFDGNNPDIRFDKGGSVSAQLKDINLKIKEKENEINELNKEIDKFRHDFENRDEFKNLSPIVKKVKVGHLFYEELSKMDFYKKYKETLNELNSLKIEKNQINLSKKGFIASLSKGDDWKSKMKQLGFKTDFIKKFNSFQSQNTYLISYRDAHKNINEDNYYIGTDADFKSLNKWEEKDWEEIKAIKNGKHSVSPKSSSEYVVVGNLVYRYSDHWGRVASCHWTLDGSSYDSWMIGVADLTKDFKLNGNSPYLTVNPVYESKEYKELKKGAVKEFRDFLNSDKIKFSDALKLEIEKHILEVEKERKYELGGGVPLLSPEQLLEKFDEYEEQIKEVQYLRHALHGESEDSIFNDSSDFDSNIDKISDYISEIDLTGNETEISEKIRGFSNTEGGNRKSIIYFELDNEDLEDWEERDAKLDDYKSEAFEEITQEKEKINDIIEDYLGELDKLWDESNLDSITPNHHWKTKPFKPSGYLRSRLM